MQDLEKTCIDHRQLVFNKYIILWRSSKITTRLSWDSSADIVKDIRKVCILSMMCLLMLTTNERRLASSFPRSQLTRTRMRRLSSWTR